jgi:hypothetical protein
MPIKKQIYCRQISETDKLRAVVMWEHGSDTFHIAEKLRRPESQIYNNLRKWRGVVDERANAA